MAERTETTRRDETTVIDANTKVKGTIAGDCDLAIAGHVEGDIRLSESLIVEIGARVNANAVVRRAVVSGTLEGNITASEIVEITGDGHVHGDLVAPRVIFEDGATFSGHLDMGNRLVDGSSRTASPNGKSFSSIAHKSAHTVAHRAVTQKPIQVARNTKAQPGGTRAATASKALSGKRGAPKAKSAAKPATSAGRKSRARRK